MNSFNENEINTEDGILNGSDMDDTSKNLLKLEQLTELGLEIFCDTGKFDNELSSGNLQLNLLRRETENSNCLQNASSSDFENLNHLVSNDMISLSPDQQRIEFLESNSPNELTKKYTNVNNGFANHLRNNTDKDYELPSKSAKNNLKHFNNINKHFFRRNNSNDDKKNKIRQKITASNVRYFSGLRKSSSLQRIANDTLDECPVIDYTDLLKDYEEYNDSENKINECLLDMLQNKMVKSSVNKRSNFRREKQKVEKESLKFITIFPSKPNGKVINLMVKGKTCRSKQPLSDIELRTVTRILGQENIFEKTENHYKNVYYDAESDTNIRYEVKRETLLEGNNSENHPNFTNKNKRGRSKSSQRIFEENGNKKEEKYVLSSVARTRCGRISRPPRHVIRDYKRLKHLSAPVSDVEDENENTGGYADYRIVDELHTTTPIKEKEENKTENLYAPLEPVKRQFSSLSLCPACGKVYLGYKRMAIHFQKYPEHKNEDLLNQLLNAKKKSFDDCSLFDGVKISFNDDVSSPPNNGAIKKKRKMCRKIKMQDPKNISESVKELLSDCGTEEIIKCVSPIVVRVLDSWQYLVMRSKQLKKDEETLVTTLLREINAILKQIRSLSHFLLKPCIENKENLPNKLTIEDENILQYVLGVTPGTYLIVDDDNLIKESLKTISNNTEVDEFKTRKQYSDQSKLKSEKLCTPRDSSPESCCRINEYDESSFPMLNIIQNTENDRSGSESNDNLINVVNSDIINSGLINDNNSIFESNLCRNDRVGMLFDHLNDPNESHSALSSQNNVQFENIKSASINNESKLEYVSEFDGKTFCAAHPLNFDFVHNDDDINDFPASLPLLSHNSSESKDCLQILKAASAEDLLNNLKNMDSTAESTLIEFQNAVNADLPSSADGIHSSTSFDDLVNRTSSSPCLLDFTSMNSHFHCN